jgi:predicted amidohydrolase YtcJ
VERQAEIVAKQGAGDDWLKLGGLKAFMDGSLGSTTALFFEPFSDAPNTSGLMVDDNIPEGKLKQNIKDADKAGLQCSIHTSRQANKSCSITSKGREENGPRDRRFRIEHAQHLCRDIARFASSGDCIDAAVSRDR